MIISHEKIIAFHTIIIRCLWVFYIARKDYSLYNKQNNTCVLELPAADLFLVLHMISHSFAAVTREISHLEINLVFPHDNLGSKGGASG